MMSSQQSLAREAGVLRDSHEMNNWHWTQALLIRQTVSKLWKIEHK